MRQAFRNQANQLFSSRESNLPDLGPDVQAGPLPLLPKPPNAADPLVSVDAVMAAQREQSGPLPSTTYTHPEQYDPVFRAHLRMGPVPDPYEAQRRCRTR